MALPKSFSMETIPSPPVRRVSVPSFDPFSFFGGADSLEEEDERRGTYMGMTESEFLGDVGDK